MSDCQPFQAPFLSPDQVVLRNRLSSAHLPLVIETDSARFTLNLSLTTELPSSTLKLHLQVGNVNVTVFTPEHSMQRWLRQSLNVNALPGLPPELVMALLEKSLAPLYPVIIEHLGGELSAEQIQPGTCDKPLFFLSVLLTRTTSGQEPAPLLVFMKGSDAVARRWIAKLPAQPHQTLELLPIRITLVTGSTTLYWSDFTHLQPGDIVLFDNKPLEPGTVTLRANGKAIARGTVTDDQCIVSTCTGVAMETREDPLNEPLTENPPVTAETTEAQLDLNSLPIQLDFELGSVLLPLEVVKTLSPGYVFQLDSLIEQPVSITVNGQKIAEGELVRIDRHTGVRIVRFGGQDTAQ